MIKHICNSCGAVLESADDRAGCAESCECGVTNVVPSSEGQYVSATEGEWRTPVAFTLGVISVGLAWPAPGVAIVASVLGVVLVWREARTARSLALLAAAVLCSVGLTVSAVIVLTGV
jgi:hypothetical protein